MRRAVIAITGTIAGLFALLGYKSGAPPHRLTTGTSPVPDTAAPTGAGTAPETTPTTARPKATGGRTVEGTDFPNRFGDVQVRLVITNGRITDVQAVQLPNDRPRSAEISDIAGPQLRQEVLDTQSAQIDGVSGATYTSDSYARSVQSALDKAGIASNP